LGTLLKLRLNDDRIISINPLIRSTTNKNAIKNLLNMFKTNLDIKSNDYEVVHITHIIFSFHIYDLDYNKLIVSKDPFELNLADKLSNS
jgi:hypothetical protein